jgi:excisionase family DNA binding protein
MERHCFPLLSFLGPSMSKSTDKKSDCKRCRERLLSVREAARMLSISPKSVRNRLSLGTFEIPARKLGGRVLFLRSEVLKFMKSLPQVGGAQTEDEETN